MALVAPTCIWRNDTDDSQSCKAKLGDVLKRAISAYKTLAEN